MTMGGLAGRLRNRLGLALAGFTGIDIALHFGVIPELLGLGESVIVPSLLAITTAYVLDLGIFVWLLDWAVLFVLGALTIPYLVPRTLQHWGKSLWVRFAIATAAIASAMLVEQVAYRLLEPEYELLFYYGPIPAAVGLVGAATAGLLFVATGVHSLTFKLIGSRSGSPVADADGFGDGRTSVRRRVFHGTVMAISLGIVFGNAMLLTPLLQSAFLVFLALARLHPADVTGSDPTDRLSVGTIAAWGEPHHVTALLYSLLALTYVSFIGLSGVGVNPVRQLLTQGIAGITLFGCFFVIPIFHVVTYVERLFRVFATDLEDRIAAAPPGLDAGDAKRAPGFLLPAGVLLGVSRLVFEMYDDPADTMGWIPWSVILIVAGVTLVVPFLRAPVRLQLSDYHATPLAVALLVAVEHQIGEPSHGTSAGIVGRFLHEQSISTGMVLDSLLFTLLAIFVFLLPYLAFGTLTYISAVRDETVARALGSLRLASRAWLFGTGFILFTGRIKITQGGFEATAANSSLETFAVAAIGLVMYATLFYAAWSTLRGILSGGLVPRFEVVRESDSDQISH